MPIHTIAHYRVKPSGVDKVKQAIAEFVPHIRANEARHPDLPRLAPEGRPDLLCAFLYF
jgi:hypothetical protein